MFKRKTGTVPSSISTKEPNRLSKPRTNSNSISGPTSSAPLSPTSPRSQTSQSPSVASAPPLPYPPDPTGAEPLNMTSNESSGELAHQVRHRLSNITRSPPLRPQRPDESQIPSVCSTIPATSPSLSLFPMPDKQPHIDLDATITLLQELRKNASPRDLVALHRALLPGHSMPQTHVIHPSQTPNPQTKVQNSTPSSTLIRRRSHAVPGIATRGPGDPVRRPLGSDYDSASSASTGSQESSLEAQLAAREASAVYPRPRTSDSHRSGAQTPGDISHLGSLQPGTLVITNGDAASICSGISRHTASRKNYDPQEEGYFTSSEGRPSLDGATFRARKPSGHASPPTSRRGNPVEDALALANSCLSEMPPSPFVSQPGNAPTEPRSATFGPSTASATATAVTNASTVAARLNRSQSFPTPMADPHSIGPSYDEPPNDSKGVVQRPSNPKTDSGYSSSSSLRAQQQDAKTASLRVQAADGAPSVPPPGSPSGQRPSTPGLYEEIMTELDARILEMLTLESQEISRAGVAAETKHSRENSLDGKILVAPNVEATPSRHAAQAAPAGTPATTIAIKTPDTSPSSTYRPTKRFHKRRLPSFHLPGMGSPRPSSAFPNPANFSRRPNGTTASIHAHRPKQSVSCSNLPETYRLGRDPFGPADVPEAPVLEEPPTERRHRRTVSELRDMQRQSRLFSSFISLRKKIKKPNPSIDESAQVQPPLPKAMVVPSAPRTIIYTVPPAQPVPSLPYSDAPAVSTKSNTPARQQHQRGYSMRRTWSMVNMSEDDASKIQPHGMPHSSRAFPKPTDADYFRGPLQPLPKPSDDIPPVPKLRSDKLPLPNEVLTRSQTERERGRSRMFAHNRAHTTCMDGTPPRTTHYTPATNRPHYQPHNDRNACISQSTTNAGSRTSFSSSSFPSILTSTAPISSAPAVAARGVSVERARQQQQQQPMQQFGGSSGAAAV